MISFKREKGIENVKAADGKSLIYYLSITEDNNNNLWMVTYNEGVWQYNPSGKKMIQHRIKDGSKDLTLFSIYKDNQGVLWLGTHEAGVYKFDGTEFEKFNQ